MLIINFTTLRHASRSHGRDRGNRRNPRSGGCRLLVRVPVEPAVRHGSRRRRGHRTDRRPPRADGRTHGRRRQSGDLGRRDRRVRLPARPRDRECVRGRRAGVRRVGPDRCVSARVRPGQDRRRSEIQFVPQLPARHQVLRAVDGPGSGRRDGPPGIQRRTKRSAAPGARRDSHGRLGRGHRRGRLRAHLILQDRPGSGRRPACGRHAARRPATGHLRRPGRPLREGLGVAPETRRTRGGPGHH